MKKAVLKVVAVSAVLLCGTQNTFAAEPALGFGNERCQTWINAQKGGDTEARKFAMEEWYLGYVNAFYALKGLTYNGAPPETVINMMTAACKVLPNETLSTVAHASTNLLEKRLNQRGG